MEKWIKGYEGLYKITSEGQVFHFYFGQEKPKKTYIHRAGYIAVQLSNGNRKNYLVHRLVAIAFIPNPENKLYINHKNGIKDDNRIENLEWVTKSENAIHAFRHGLSISMKGESNVFSKLTDEIVLKVRNEQGKTQKELAALYGTSRTVIGYALNGKTWKHLPVTTYIPRGNGLGKDEIDEIIRRRSTGETQSKIAADFGITQVRVSQICRQK